MRSTRPRLGCRAPVVVHRALVGSTRPSFGCRAVGTHHRAADALNRPEVRAVSAAAPLVRSTVPWRRPLAPRLGYRAAGFSTGPLMRSTGPRFGCRAADALHGPALRLPRCWSPPPGPGVVPWRRARELRSRANSGELQRPDCCATGGARSEPQVVGCSVGRRGGCHRGTAAEARARWRPQRPGGAHQGRQPSLGPVEGASPAR